MPHIRSIIYGGPQLSCHFAEFGGSQPLRNFAEFSRHNDQFSLHNTEFHGITYNIIAFHNIVHAKI